MHATARIFLRGCLVVIALLVFSLASYGGIGAWWDLQLMQTDRGAPVVERHDVLVYWIHQSNDKEVMYQLAALASLPADEVQLILYEYKGASHSFIYVRNALGETVVHIPDLKVSRQRKKPPIRQERTGPLALLQFP